MVGRIGKPQGIRGELTVEVRTDDPAERFAVGRRLLTEPADRGPLTVTASALRSGRWVLAVEGVGDREAAERLRDTVLFVPMSSLPVIDDPDEFYDHELLGLVAALTDGTRVGVLSDVLHGPAGDLLVIDRDGRELLVPFLRDMVPTIDIPGGRVVLDPPEGLLEL